MVKNIPCEYNAIDDDYDDDLKDFLEKMGSKILMNLLRV